MFEKILGTMIIVLSFYGIKHDLIYSSFPGRKLEEKMYTPNKKDFDIELLNYRPSYNKSSLLVTLYTTKIITEVTSEYNDAALSKYYVNSNTVSCYIDDSIDKASIKIVCETETKEYGDITLYFAENKNVLYVSDKSYDDACFLSGKEMLYSFEKDVDLAAKHENLYSPKALGASGKVTGYATWKDEQNVTRPLFGAKVTLKIDGSWWTGTTYTDINGYFEINYSEIWYVGSGKPTLAIFTESNNVKVTRDDAGVYKQSYTFSSNGNNSYNFTFYKDSDMGQSMMILQGAKLFSDVAKSFNNNIYLSSCEIVYPCSTGIDCYYQNNKINIIGGNPGTHGSYFSNWDVLGHEYGHHFQKCLGVTVPVPLSHIWSTPNMIDFYYTEYGYSLENAKRYGLRTAWLEGWAIYWSVVAQKSFPSIYRDVLYVNDSSFTTPTNYDNDLEGYRGTNDVSYGDADERAISCILYKVGSPSTDVYDDLSIGFNNLLAELIDNAYDNFSSFVNSFYDNHSVSYLELGKLLEAFGVLTSGVSFSDIGFNTIPSITISNRKGSDYFKYNKFEFIFENLNGDVVKRIYNVDGLISGDTFTHQLSSNDWYTIRMNYGSSVNFYFISYQTSYFQTGGYYSSMYSMPLPTL